MAITTVAIGRMNLDVNVQVTDSHVTVTRLLVAVETG